MHQTGLYVKYAAFASGCLQAMRFSVDLCRLKAFKALLLVMVVSESGSENATRQAAQNGETPLTHINSGTARSGKMIAGSSL